jgi:hypothetical protein
MTDKPREYAFTGRTGNKIRITVRPPLPPRISVASWNMGDNETDQALIWSELRECLAKVEAMEKRLTASERNRQNRASVATDAEVLARWYEFVEANEAAGKRATVSAFARTKPFGLGMSALYAKIPKAER